jgi:hypothetical protein
MGRPFPYATSPRTHAPLDEGRLHIYLQGSGLLKAVVCPHGAGDLREISTGVPVDLELNTLTLRS